MKKIIPLITITILLVISSVFLFAQNQNLKNEIGILNNKIADLEKQKSTNITPTPAAEKPPEDWKEYIDKEYNFKVWYPEKFTAYGETAKTRIEKLQNIYGLKDNWIDEVQIYMPLINDLPVDLLRIYIYKDNQDMNDFIVNNLSPYLEDISNTDKYIKLETINTLVIYKVVVYGQATRYYVKKNGYIFKLQTEGTVESLPPNQENISNQMINSFKFIE